MISKDTLPNISGLYIKQNKLRQNNGKSRKVRQQGDLVKIVYQQTNTPGYGQVYYNSIAQAYFLKYWKPGGLLVQGKILDGNTKISFKENSCWKKV